MKSIQNKTLLGMLLISVASTSAMQQPLVGRYDRSSRTVVKAPVVVPTAVAPQSRMEKVTGAFKAVGSKVQAAGNKVKSGVSAVAGKAQSGLNTAKNAVVAGSVAAYDKTKNGVISAYNYVGPKVASAAKVASEKAGQVWNYNHEVTFRGQQYNVPAGKIGVGIAAAGIAYGVYKMAAKHNQTSKTFAAFDEFFSVVNAQAELCKQAAIENKRANVTNVLNVIKVAYRQLSTKLVRLAKTEKDAEYMQTVVLPVLFEYVRAVEYACQGLEYTFTVSEDGRVAKSQISRGFYVGNNREMLIAESMVFLSSYMEEFLKPLAQDILNNGSEKNPSLVARAKSVLANIADSAKSAAAKAKDTATVAKAVVVTAVNEHPYIAAGVATAAVAGGAYAAYKTGYYPTVAGVKAAGNRAIESTQAGYNTAKTAVANTAVAAKDKAIAAKNAVASFEYKQNAKDAFAATKNAVTSFEYKQNAKNALTATKDAMQNGAIVAKDAVKNAAITTKDAVVAHPYKAAGIVAGTLATTGASYAGYQYIKSDKRQITIALNTLLAKAQEAIYSNMFFVPQANDSMINCLAKAGLIENLIPVINELNDAIEARNQQDTMKAYVTLKQYVASIIDNLDSILQVLTIA